jgi:hypothetical protein
VAPEPYLAALIEVHREPGAAVALVGALLFTVGNVVRAISSFERTLGFLTEHAPSFSLRGGTREVLRGIIARGLGLR